MSATLVQVNQATTNGGKILNDSIGTLDGGAAPAEALAQVAKMAWGGAGIANQVSETRPLPIQAASAPFWRVGFAEVGAGLQGLAAQEMTLVQTGPGMAVNQSGGNLVITTGTTANSETVIRSNLSFRGSLNARYKAILSQRIANQTFRFELSDLIDTGLSYTINSATSVTVTFPTTNPFTAANVGQSMRLSTLSSVGIPGRYAIASVSGLTVTFTVAAWPASGSGSLTLYGHNFLANEYTGTTATNSSFDCQRRGWASGNTTATIATTAAPGHVVQFAFDVFAVGMADALVTSNAGYQWTGRASRIENIPDEDVDLYFFLVVQNGSTAPASTTTLTVGLLQVEDQGRQKVRLASVDPGSAHPAPVQVMNPQTSVTVTGTPTIGGSAAIDATLAGNPVPAGLRASNANIAAMSAAGDVVAWLATMIGVPVVKPHALQEASWNYTGQLTTTSDVPAQTAAGAGLRRHAVGLVLANTAASAISVNLRDGTTTRQTITLQANQTLFVDLAGLLTVTANTALNLSLSAAGTVQVAMWGYTAP
jgi:hypothetical protein